MITELLFVAAIVAAVVTVGLRRRRRSRLRRSAATREGSSPDKAIYVQSFGDIDQQLSQRWCHCGGFLERRGEGSREIAGRRYRIARLECQECEAEQEVFFDTTDVPH